MPTRVETNVAIINVFYAGITISSHASSGKLLERSARERERDSL